MFSKYIFILIYFYDKVKPKVKSGPIYIFSSIYFYRRVFLR